MPGRRGVTLIEVLVALTVLSVGVVALAGVAAPVAQLANGGLNSTRLAALVSRRLETLYAGACSGSTQGAERLPTADLRWTVSDEGAGRRLTLTVESRVARTPRSFTISRLVGCHA